METPQLETEAEKGDVDHFQHLNDHEREVVMQQLRVPDVAVSYGTLYRYADGRDILLLNIGAIGSIVAGVVMPLMTILFGHFAGIFSDFLSGHITDSKFNHDLREFSLYFVYLGIASLVAVFISMLCFSFTGERMTQKIRESYLRAILRQNIGYFDNVGAGEVATRITADISLIEDGLSQKVGLTITGLATFVAALVVGFIKSWKLTLVMMSVTITIILVMGGIGSNMKKFQAKSLSSSATGGTLAEDVVSSIRTTTAFGSQESLIGKYEGPQTEAANFDYKAKTALGFMLASMFCILNLQYGLAFWQGSRFLKDGDVSVSAILTVLFASMLAGVSLGHIAPYIGAFGMATAAARKVFQTIDRPSSVDCENENGERPVLVAGELSFENVRYVYPSRPEQVILDDFTLRIPPGKMTALVGASGSGKSTVIGLIERFYLPIGGKLSLDGRSIDGLNIRWLRAQLSLVSQEPVLFNTTIFKNIEYGLLGTERDEHDASKSHEAARREALVYEAARIANAADFIERLPHGFQTRVGEGGSLLSGGQKQRIAIARAVISNPKILLLDEATAALDTKSEGAVQVALEAASKGRTTVVIAHRLSTIKHADNIVVMAAGKIIEQGTHEELLELKNAYFSLVQTQKIGSGETASDRLMSSEDGEKEYLVDGEKGIIPQNAALETGLKEEELKTTPGAFHAIPSTWTLIKFIWTMNENEKGAMILGFLTSILCGMGYPITAIFTGNAIISITAPSASNGGHDINFWCLMFLMLGVVMFISYGLQGTGFAFASSRLVLRARVMAFRAILRQEIAFFDMDENASGTLAAFLSLETNYLAGISGATLGAILNFLVTIIGALVVSCSFGWKLALVCASTMPILLSCGYLRFWVLSRLESDKKKETDAAGFACEATSSIRTVASLSLESYVRQHYHEMLDIQATRDLKDVTQSSALYAMSQSFTFFAMGLAFWYGGTLIVRGEYTVQQFFVCFIAVIWGSQAAGSVFSYAPDMGHAKQAAYRLKTLLERTPAIDSWSELGVKVPDLEGTVEFRNVSFSYPARPEQQVLNEISFIAKPGQLVALVGSSGSGKSTTVALLERFYDPSSGGVFVDGHDISTYHLQDYRSHLALVSQETTIYMGTIKENILTGKSDATDEEIIQACQDANIYDFIMSLPDGLSTPVGAKGALLSGGQKQRIAIAKALLRDPKILLLDEATSALDSSSEKAVQIALDRAAKGRTTISIAHRLSTIQHADMIYVFDGGAVVESGTHGELMGRKGRYCELVKLQGLGGAGALEEVK